VASPTSTGYYTVVHGSGAACSATDSVLITVFPTPSPTIIIAGDSLYLAGTYSQYIWILDGVALPGGTNPYWIATRDGNYSVTVTSPEGCVGSSSATQFITGIQEAGELSQLLVFPNPSQGFIVLETKNTGFYGTCEMTLYDETGRLVLLKTVEVPIRDTQFAVDLSRIADGNYSLTLQGDRITATVPVVIVR
jgi:hypothetical protein